MSVVFLGGCLPEQELEDASRDVLELVREASIRALKSQKAAAIEMGVDHAQLSRQLSGLERFPLAQLAKAPAVLAEFAALLAEHCGHRVQRAQPKTRPVVELRQELRRFASLLDQLLEDGRL